MSEQPLVYRDRSYHGDLEIEVRGEYLRVEYSPDGYTVDALYLPCYQLFHYLLDHFTEEK